MTPIATAIKCAPGRAIATAAPPGIDRPPSGLRMPTVITNLQPLPGWFPPEEQTNPCGVTSVVDSLVLAALYRGTGAD